MASATPERMLKAGDGLGARLTDGGQVGQRVDVRPIDMLLSRGSITMREFQAADRYRMDAYIAKMDPGPPSVDWRAVGGNFGPRIPSEYSSQRIFDKLL